MQGDGRQPASTPPPGVGNTVHGRGENRHARASGKGVGEPPGVETERAGSRTGAGWEIRERGRSPDGTRPVLIRVNSPRSSPPHPRLQQG